MAYAAAERGQSQGPSTLDKIKDIGSTPVTITMTRRRLVFTALGIYAAGKYVEAKAKEVSPLIKSGVEQSFKVGQFLDQGSYAVAGSRIDGAVADGKDAFATSVGEAAEKWKKPSTQNSTKK